MKNTFVIILLITLFSCSPRLRSNIIKKVPKLDEKELVVVLGVNDKQEINAEKIGEVRAVEGGFSLNCTYVENVENLKFLARNSGANLVKITKYKKPTRLGSDCHRLWANIYRLDNVKKFETEIEWSVDRKLTWDDFKGTPDDENYSHAAAITYSSIFFQFRIGGILKPKFIIKSSFDNYKSWVRPIGRTDYVLKHEQTHFDITEIYTRKLRKEINNLKIKPLKEETLRNIFEDIKAQLIKRQLRYDYETKNSIDNETQKKWDSIVKAELAKYDLYKSN